jgi:putative membrane protein
MRFVSHPVTALTLNIAGMAVVYFTPLYRIMQHSALVHHWVHVHFLLAGYLFAWAIAGPDPALHRPTVPYRLAVLGVGIFLHASLSQLMYANFHVRVDAPLAQLRGGAELMYYGGDIAELLLAFAMVSTWRPRRRSRGQGGRRAGHTAIGALMPA